MVEENLILIPQGGQESIFAEWISSSFELVISSITLHF